MNNKFLEQYLYGAVLMFFIRISMRTPAGISEFTLYILFRQMGNGFDPSTKQNRTTCRNELTVK